MKLKIGNIYNLNNKIFKHISQDLFLELVHIDQDINRKKYIFVDSDGFSVTVPEEQINSYLKFYLRLNLLRTVRNHLK